MSSVVLAMGNTAVAMFPGKFATRLDLEDSAAFSIRFPAGRIAPPLLASDVATSWRGNAALVVKPPE